MFKELSRLNSETSAPFRGGSIIPDGLNDEDFESRMGTRIEVSNPLIMDEDEDTENEHQDISRLGIIEYVGDDVFGRKVIVFSACKLPPKTELDHMRLLESQAILQFELGASKIIQLEKFNGKKFDIDLYSDTPRCSYGLQCEKLKFYMKHTLDQYVENDYVIVYFHHGLTSKNKPNLFWMVQVYKELDTKYKKNLKALYVVHPTSFIRILWFFFTPLISVKFGKNVMYVNYLHELNELLHFDQLKVPDLVLQYNAKLLSSSKPSNPYDSSKHQGEQILPFQQFGVTLHHIKSKCGSTIPPVVEETVEFLRQHALDREGIFRRSANVTILKEVQQKFNQGLISRTNTIDHALPAYYEMADQGLVFAVGSNSYAGIPVNFAELNDVNIPAVLLKTFLRQLKEPILTFDLFEPITRLHGLEREKQVSGTQKMLREELPEDNYQVLKYIIDFLVEVAAHSEKNKMTSTNLAIVFGPNLIWPKDKISMSIIENINTFALILIDHFDELFTR